MSNENEADKMKPVLETTQKLYNEFSPENYLSQFYTTEIVTHDEEVIYAELFRWLRQSNRRYQRAIEVGCGPTIHHALPLAPYVDSLTLADYSARNRNILTKWWRGTPDAHDWNVYIRRTLELGGGGIDGTAVDERTTLMRNCISDVCSCDLLQPAPLGKVDQFDLVSTFYTLENVAGDRESWPRIMSNFTSLCRPGGMIWIVAARHCNWYEFEGNRYPTASIDENDFLTVLPGLGFPSSNITVNAHPIRGWEQEGLQQIITLKAIRELST